MSSDAVCWCGHAVLKEVVVAMHVVVGFMMRRLRCLLSEMRP